MIRQPSLGGPGSWDRRARNVDAAGFAHQISTGHLGYSWTVEGGIVEVFTDGRSIRRAPLSAPIMSDGSRIGREWWPDREPFRDLWYALTFATIAEAEAHRADAYR